ncbi:hypothetical protein [Paenibacillus sabinae]|uniref:Uncharacterized protein n=1 Tax=Paenibacillus sabinae T27 TaxID=1268072 RepID=X4Z8X2_9BACL|nr:hypothetical protein [Paenibacillus sabinae]AHV96156.1 hypothetical protein PSAB_06100 [Paenibacillus sabinae T27]
MAQPKFALEVLPSLGMNTALNPAQLPQGANRIAYDAEMKAINTIGKRPGSAPVTNSALGSGITLLIPYKAAASSVAPDLFAVSGTTLYKFNGTDTLTAQTMTNALDSSNVFGVGYTDYADVSNLLLTSGGYLKQYDGTQVKNVTPAADDPSPPVNKLTTINARGLKYIWVHTGHVFVSDGTDLMWYSKRYHYDYFPGDVQYFRFIRDNDYVTGPGITYNNQCLIPMRRGWGVIIGETFDDGSSANPFKANLYLNTVTGNIAPKGFTKVTYPNGTQTIVFLSDDGVHEIYDTGVDEVETSGTRQYSTRALMKEKIDFASYGFTDAEKSAAVATFNPDKNQFMLSIKRDTTNYIFVYDTRNQEWYLWRSPWAVQAFSKFNDTLYFGTTTGHLHAYSDDLYTDWNDKAKTTGTVVDFDVISGLISFEFSGDNSYLHHYLTESQMYNQKSSLDVYMVYGTGVVNLPKALYNEIFVWGVTSWGEGQWANLEYTDNVNNAKRLVIHKKAKYFQRRWRNNRDEPTLILREKFLGTTSNRG